MTKLRKQSKMAKQTSVKHLGDVAFCECSCHTKGSEWNKKNLCKECYVKVSPKLRKQSKASLPKLKRKLWRLFSAYIKKRDGNTYISFNKTGLIGADWQAGHYIKAELCNLEYRYDDRNVNSQCGACNLWKRGNTIAYRNAMLDKYGVKTVKELDAHYNDPLPLNFDTRA